MNSLQPLTGWATLRSKDILCKSNKTSISITIYKCILQHRAYDAQDNEVPDQSFSLSNYFFNASLLPQAGFIDNAIRGLTKQPPLIINPEYTSELTNYLNKQVLDNSRH